MVSRILTGLHASKLHLQQKGQVISLLMGLPDEDLGYFLLLAPAKSLEFCGKDAIGGTDPPPKYFTTMDDTQSNCKLSKEVKILKIHR